MYAQVCATLLAVAVLVGLTLAWALSTKSETVRILPLVGVLFKTTARCGLESCFFLDWQHVGPVVLNEVRI